MVLVGVPEHAVSVHAFSVIAGRKSLSGSMIGSIKETRERLDSCGKHDIVSEIEKINIGEINEPFERMLFFSRTCRIRLLQKSGFAILPTVTFIDIEAKRDRL